MQAVGPAYGFGLYVHWPYCARICPYCDFNVYAAKGRDSQPLLGAILEDIRAHRDRLTDHPALDSVFLGGGTPSLLSATEIAKVLDAARETFGLNDHAEVTLEANPNDILGAAMDGWRDAGVNRLSIGAQSFNDEALSFLGRDHDSATAKAAIDRAGKVFENFSIDMIYARPRQSKPDWERELTDALALNAPHLSLYELTIEARTAFGKRAQRGNLIPMPDDDQADLYEITQALCEAHGLSAYEVSNHARTADYEARHNHIYWNSGDWIGVGPGAHGRLTVQGQRYSTEAKRRPADYIADPQPELLALSEQDTAREFLAMALRPVSGLNLERYEALFGMPVAVETLAQLTDNGLASLDGDHLRLSANGRLIADHIAGLISAY